MMWRFRHPAHYVAGLVTVAGALVSWVLVLVSFGGFIIYELNEDYHLTDQAFRDILEYLIGLNVGIVIFVVLRLFGFLTP